MCIVCILCGHCAQRSTLTLFGGNCALCWPELPLCQKTVEAKTLTQRGRFSSSLEFVVAARKNAFHGIVLLFWVRICVVRVELPLNASEPHLHPLISLSAFFDLKLCVKMKMCHFTAGLWQTGSSD